MAVRDFLFGLLQKKVKKEEEPRGEENLIKKEEEEAGGEESLYDFYKRIESQTRVKQSFLWVEVRPDMLDWLTEVQEELRLAPETLFLAVNIVDRFFSQDAELWSDFKLVGEAALSLACKYEQGWSPSEPEFDEFRETYSQEEINSMEIKILTRLDWKLMVPTIHTFLVQFLSACGDIDRLFKNLAFCFGELAMNDFSTTVRYSPSLIAVSAVYAAESCMQSKIHGWDEALKSGYSKRQIDPCVEKLRLLAKLKSNTKVVKKYSHDGTWDAVALSLKRP